MFSGFLYVEQFLLKKKALYALYKFPFILYSKDLVWHDVRTQIVWLWIGMYIQEDDMSTCIQLFQRVNTKIWLILLV